VAQRPVLFRRGRALNDFQFTGDDFFADSDVCSIVLELPNSALGDGGVGLLHRAPVSHDDANRVQRRAPTPFTSFDRCRWCRRLPSFADFAASALQRVRVRSGGEPGKLEPEILKLSEW
jgi:hypothetical protein